MKFAILGSRGFPSTYGGYETLVRELAPHLVRRGHEVAVYCRSREGTPRTWTVDGVRCIWTPGNDKKSLSTLTFGMTATADAAFRDFDSMLVLNIANGFWFPALRAARIPFAVNTDGVEWERAKWSALGRMMFRAGAQMTARHAGLLICDSKAMGDIWREFSGRESHFIPYGAAVPDTVGRDRLDAVVPDVCGASYVLVVARLAPENNVELTLDALELLGDDAPLAVVVGSANFVSPLETRLKTMAAAGKVKWLGHVADQDLLTQLWAHSATYVHGHSVGGTNPALLQALGAGAPTLALDTRFNLEVLQDPAQLYSHDATVLADRLRDTLASPVLQQQMTEHGRAVVRERYNWEDVCDEYTEALIGLAAGRTKPPQKDVTQATAEDGSGKLRAPKMTRLRRSPERVSANAD